MLVVPVLDVLDGLAVRGVAGRREEYRPVRSVFPGAPDPRALARAFRERLGLDTLYVADLDGIVRDRPNLPLCRELADDGFRLLIDAGVRCCGRARDVLKAGAEAAVVGLETLPGVSLLAELTAGLGPERVVFSLDLGHGRPLGDTASWRSDDPGAMALEARELGVRRMILLDLAGVGTGGGVSTRALCASLRRSLPDVQLVTGGGVRDASDLAELAALGLDGTLVASALHDGRVTRDDVAALGLLRLADSAQVSRPRVTVSRSGPEAGSSPADFSPRAAR